MMVVVIPVFSCHPIMSNMSSDVLSFHHPIYGWIVTTNVESVLRINRWIYHLSHFNHNIDIDDLSALNV